MAREPRSAQDLLPLAPLPFHILLALSEGERHGYAIKKSVEETSEGTLKPGAGSLYNAIKGLLSDGLIDEADERPDPHLDDERRRYYRLTAFGQDVVRAEMARLTALLKKARRFPGLGKSEA